MNPCFAVVVPPIIMVSLSSSYLFHLVSWARLRFVDPPKRNPAPEALVSLQHIFPFLSTDRLSTGIPTRTKSTYFKKRSACNYITLIWLAKSFGNSRGHPCLYYPILKMQPTVCSEVTLSWRAICDVSAAEEHVQLFQVSADKVDRRYQSLSF